MKKVTNKSLIKGLTRAMLAFSGIVCTTTIALFMDNIYGVIAVVIVGAMVICGLDSHISTQNNKY